MTLTIELLNSKIHDRSNFDSGVESLNRYLAKTASQNLKRKVATVFVLVEKPNNKVLAYYTLSAFTIKTTELNPSLAKKLPRYPLLPATMLGCLAVDRDHRGQGFGKLMLVDALHRSFSATQQIASIAVVVEALDDKAIAFYQKWGFMAFTHQTNRLYLPMQVISKIINNR